MADLEQLVVLDSSASPEAICACVSRIFQVRGTEVALLELHGRMLSFVYPPELKSAGAIPITSSAVAARTAQSRHAEAFNGFAEVRHHSVFELIKLGESGVDKQVIQKLMSAPVLSPSGTVLGVIQVSRKAPTLALAGPDFSPEDLRKLESVGRFVGRLLTKTETVAKARAK